MTGKRLIGAAAVMALAAGAALIAGSLSSSTPSASAGSGGGTGAGSGGGAQASSGASAPSRCHASSLEVWVGVGPGGAAAGSTYVPIEFTNTGSASCSLYGYPGVSARTTQQLGSPAARNPQVASRTVTLAPGATAHSVLQITDVGNYPPATCAPASATTLRVYPPGSFTGEDIAFRLRACSKAGPQYLSVTALAPGVGVPGRL